MLAAELAGGSGKCDGVGDVAGVGKALEFRKKGLPDDVGGGAENGSAVVSSGAVFGARNEIVAERWNGFALSGGGGGGLSMGGIGGGHVESGLLR